MLKRVIIEEPEAEAIKFPMLQVDVMAKTFDHPHGGIYTITHAIFKTKLGVLEASFYKATAYPIDFNICGTCLN